MRFLAAGDFLAAQGREIVVLDGPDLQLTAADGRVLGAARAPVTFADAVPLPGAPRDTLRLASGLGGDDALFRVTSAPGWEEALTQLPRSATTRTRSRARPPPGAVRLWPVPRRRSMSS